MIFKWDSTYNAAPADTLIRTLIDDELRQMKYAIRERASVEHEWGSASDINDGSHIQGGTTVCLLGTSAARDALVDPQAGSLYIVQDGANYIVSLYRGGAWGDISSLDHSDLINTNVAADHPQYVSKFTGVMTGALDMGDNVLNTAAVNSPFLGNVALWYHRKQAHPSYGDISCIADETIPGTKLITEQTEVTCSVANNYFVGYEGPEFFPQVYQTAAGGVFYFVFGGYPTTGWGLSRYTGGSGTFRIRREWLV